VQEAGDALLQEVTPTSSKAGEAGEKKVKPTSATATIAPYLRLIQLLPRPLAHGPIDELGASGARGSYRALKTCPPPLCRGPSPTPVSAPVLLRDMSPLKPPRSSKSAPLLCDSSPSPDHSLALRQKPPVALCRPLLAAPPRGRFLFWQDFPIASQQHPGFPARNGRSTDCSPNSAHFRIPTSATRLMA